MSSLNRILVLGRQRVILGALLLLGFALRTFRLDFQEFRADEGFSYLFSLVSLQELIGFIVERGEPHPPTHFLILGWIGDLAGDSEFVLRYPSMLISVLLLPLMYHIGRTLHSRRLGLLAMGLTAVAPMQIWIAQDVRNQYPLVTTTGALATAVLMQALRAKSARAKWGWWGFYAVSAALTMYSHYYGIFPLMGHTAFMLVKLFRQPSGRRQFGYWLVSGLIALILFAPWLLIAVPALLREQLASPSSPKLSEHLTISGIELLLGSSFSVDKQGLERWLFLGAAILAGWGAVFLYRRHKAWAVALLTWLFATLLIQFLIRFSRSSFNHFYVTAALPTWTMLLSFGLLALWQQRRWVAQLTLGILLGASLYSLQNHYFDPAFSKSWGYRAVAAHLEREAQVGDVFVAHFPDPNFDYYFRDFDLPRTMAPRQASFSTADTEQQLADLAQAYNRIWFVPAHKSHWDPENVAFNWLDTHNLREQEARYTRLDLLAYRVPTAVEQVMQPVGRRLRDELELTHLYITIEGQPVDLSQPIEVAPGQRLRVTLAWAALEGIMAERSYTVFVHLLGDDGQLITQHDGIPMQGTRPTTLWQPGEQLFDVHELVVPEDAAVDAGTLFIGLYDTNTLERQAFEDGVDTWAFTRVIIQD